MDGHSKKVKKINNKSKARTSARQKAYKVKRKKENRQRAKAELVERKRHELEMKIWCGIEYDWAGNRI